jgi:hypothetical protein
LLLWPRAAEKPSPLSLGALALTSDIQIPRTKKDEVTHLVVVESGTLRSLVIDASDENEKFVANDRIKVGAGDEAVYFFESMKNVTRQCATFMCNSAALWVGNPNTLEYQATEPEKHGIEVIQQGSVRSFSALS